MKTLDQIRPADPLRANEDAFCLESATMNGAPLPVWDEGWGKLYAIFDNCGHWSFPIGLIRARSLEEAYSAAVDEIFQGPSDEDISEMGAEMEHGEIPEGWEYRGSGNPSNEAKFPHIRSLYALVSLDISNPVRLLTRELMEEHKIEIAWKLYAAS